MNKNPFIPPPAYPTHQQPPLPPGPPPPQPAQQDYSAYWAAQQQPGAQPAFNPQWPGPNPQWPAAQGAHAAAPPKPATDQSAALYANYGYGGHQSSHWQQHAQQHQHHYAQSPAAVPPSVPPQPYNPYQPQSTATYSQPPQPYYPQGLPQQQTPAQPTFRPPQPPQAPQHSYYQQQQQQQQQQHQPRPPANPIPHVSQQQQMPPAKRPRFDNAHQSTPSQPRFQQGTQAMSMQGVPVGPSKQSGMSSLPPQPSQSQGSFSGRGGMAGGRGGGMNRGGRGGSVGTNRGMGMNRGRGGSMHGGGPSHSGGASMRGHPSRDRGGFNNNFNRRGGNSFNNRQHHHPNNALGRSGHGGRTGGSMHGGHGGRSGRSDGFHQNRGMASVASSGSSGIGKRDENRRTLTDFKIIGLELRNLGWQWGYIPSESDSGDKPEADDVKTDEATQTNQTTLVEESQEPSADLVKSNAKDSQAAQSTSNGATAARMRIYFHTPPSADDARPIASVPSVSDVRKGKRKKVDDDEGDTEDGIRAPPPPPVPNGTVNGHGNDAGEAPDSVEPDVNIERGSVAPSVAETASEDWLMAAIADGDADAEGEMDIYEQTQVESDIGVHDDDGAYEVDESMDESKVQHGNLEAQADGRTIEAGQAGDSNHTEPSIAPTSAADSVNDKVAKVEEGEGSVSQAADRPNVSVPETEGDNVGAGDLSAVKEESIELIVSSIDPSSGNSEGHDEKSTQPGDAIIKVEIDTTGKPASADAEHLPEPPASPTSNTAFSGSSASTSTANPDLPMKPVMGSPRIASANRVSIAYAAGSRRLLIDAEVVEKMTVFRAEGRIDIDITVERAEGGFKGILIETLNESKAYSPIAELSEASESDSTLPPFWKAESGTRTVINVHLDKDRPLSEPKWVKTGDVHDWLKDMFGGRFWVAGEAVGWEKKIEVRYPDPAPTIQTVLASWATNSPVGVQSERSRFLKTHMAHADNVLEILLRLVRGERATAFTQNASAISAPSIQGPLLAALDSSSPHAGQQTHVSLAVMAIFRLATQYADQALGEGKGKEQAEEKVGEIIRSLPSHLLYKSLDGMFKEWRAEKKSNR